MKEFNPGDRVIINGMGFVDEEGVILDPLNLPKGWVMEHPHKRRDYYLVKPDSMTYNGFWIPEHLLTRNPFIDPPNTVDELPTLARERIKRY